MKILGVDPGTGILGFGVIEVSRGNITCVDAGVIKTPPKQEDALRLETIFDELKGIIKQHKPEVMSVEKLFFSKNVKTAMSVAQARGVVLLLARQHKLKLHEFTPNEIKQAITGYGSANKTQMQEMVRMLLKLKEVPKPDDAADALACAITCSSHISQ